MKILIDGDGFIYRCGFAVEKTKYVVTRRFPEYVDTAFFDNHKEAKAFWEQFNLDDTHIWSRKELEPLENAIALVKGAIEAIPYEGEREIWLTPPVGNFRDRIATIAKYKGNRDTARRPTYYSELRDYLVKHHAAQFAEGQEADDALGIAQSTGGGESVIVSFDKDLNQIAGRHYNWVDREEYTVSRRDADFNFYTQVLSGDATDNIPGLPGFGPVKSRKELAGAKSTTELWSRVLDCYSAEYGEFATDVALETARLVYVRRQKEEIWTPPKAAVSSKAA